MLSEETCVRVTHTRRSTSTSKRAESGRSSLVFQVRVSACKDMLRRKWSIIAVRSQRKVQVTLYIEVLEHCEKVGDYVSRVQFDERIIDEEGQIDFLETQIGLFDRLGEERYGLSNAKPADQVE